MHLGVIIVQIAKQSSYLLGNPLRYSCLIPLYDAASFNEWERKSVNL